MFVISHTETVLSMIELSRKMCLRVEYVYRDNKGIKDEERMQSNQL